MATILEVKNFHTQFKTDAGVVKAVDDVSFKIDEKEIAGLVGKADAGNQSPSYRCAGKEGQED